MVWLIERHRVAYVGPPKSGTRSISQWFVKIGGVQRGYHHSTGPIPDGYETMLIVRSPRARCLSYHAHKLRRGKLPPGTTLAEFLRMLADPATRDAALWRNAPPQADYLDAIGPCDVFSLESLGDVQRWVQARVDRKVGQIRHAHIGGNVDRKHLWTDEEEHWLWKYEGRSMRLWGGRFGWT